MYTHYTYENLAGRDYNIIMTTYNSVLLSQSRCAICCVMCMSYPARLPFKHTRAYNGFAGIETRRRRWRRRGGYDDHELRRYFNAPRDPKRMYDLYSFRDHRVYKHTRVRTQFFLFIVLYHMCLYSIIHLLKCVCQCSGFPYHFMYTHHKIMSFSPMLLLLYYFVFIWTRTNQMFIRFIK